MSTGPDRPITYRDAGVDVDAGNAFVRNISTMVRSTFTPGVMDNFGGFGGLFRLDTQRYRKPCLVSGTDGVGTKLKIAMRMDRHDSVGIDLVAMCVNDILVQGADPLFFLDYLACSRLSSIRSEDIVAGIAEGCRQASAALIGGETAEMPDFYAEGEYDLAGFVVGCVDEDDIINGADLQPGDILLGLESSGVHSNGYSLVRKLVFDIAGKELDWVPSNWECSIGDVLLQPTRIYQPQVAALRNAVRPQAMVHVTGGGLTENIPRVLPAGCAVELALETLPQMPVFDLLQDIGNLPFSEMARTFNMGIGYIALVRAEDEPAAVAALEAAGERPRLLGQVVRGQQEVHYV